MKTRLTCPCGELIRGDSEDQLVDNVQQHLTEKHEGRTYSRDEILFMAL